MSSEQSTFVLRRLLQSLFHNHIPPTAQLSLQILPPRILLPIRRIIADPNIQPPPIILLYQASPLRVQRIKATAQLLHNTPFPQFPTSPKPHRLPQQLRQLRGNPSRVLCQWRLAMISAPCLLYNPCTICYTMIWGQWIAQLIPVFLLAVGLISILVRGIQIVDNGSLRETLAMIVSGVS